MKKAMILCAAVLVGAASASADLITSRTFGKRSKNSSTEWIVRAGVSINNAAGSAVSQAKDKMDEYAAIDKANGESTKYGFGARAGADVSVAFNKPIGRSGIYWGMELGLGSRGASYHSKTEEGADFEKCNKKILTWNVKYSPITFGYKYRLNDNIRLDAHIGAFVSYDFAGSGATRCEDEDGVYQDFSDSSHNIYNGALDYFHGLDAGLQVGVGVWFQRLNFDITYQRGFINAYDMEYESMWNVKSDACVYSSNLMLRLGWAF